MPFMGAVVCYGCRNEVLKTAWLRYGNFLGGWKSEVRGWGWAASVGTRAPSRCSQAFLIASASA